MIVTLIFSIVFAMAAVGLLSPNRFRQRNVGRAVATRRTAWPSLICLLIAIATVRRVVVAVVSQGDNIDQDHHHRRNRNPARRSQRANADRWLTGTPDHRELRADGQQKAYVVLSAEERAKGFVRPVRRSYRHVGIRPKYPTRELTAEERERYGEPSYVLYEPYPEPRASSALGRFWTQRDLESGCGTVTTMGTALAGNLRPRSAQFYGGTFCCGCGAHVPVGAKGEFVWAGTDERVGT